MTFSRGGRVRGLGLALTVLVVTTASSCVPDDREGPTDGDLAPTSATNPHSLTVEDVEEIRALMNVRAQAVLDGDRAAFLSVADDYDVDALAEQATVFDNLAQLPITDLTYVVGASARTPERIPGGDPVVRPLVVEHLSMDDFLRSRLSSSTVITFVRRDGTWLLGRESVTAETSPRPWVGRPIEVERSRGVMVLSDKDARPSSGTIARSVATRARRVASVLGRDGPEALIVDATSNGEVLALGTSNIEARAITYPLPSGNRDLSRVRGRAGTAIKINPGRVAEIVADRAVIRHELVHALLPSRFRSVPIWMSEGIAEYVGHLPRTVTQDRADAYAREVDLNDRRRELVDTGNWGYDPEGDYLIARAGVEYLVERDGIERFYDLMDDFIAAGEPDTEEATDRALQRVYGVSSNVVARGAFARLTDGG